MTDTYDQNIIEEQCVETQTCSIDDSIPDQFKTALGKMVKVIGKPYNEKMALISYSTSKIQGNALIIPAIEDVASLLDEVEKIYEDGILEDDNLEECDSIILPIDGVDISENVKGVIIDRDLRSYSNGVSWLLDPDSEALRDSGSIVNVLRSVLTFIRTMKHLCDKGVSFEKIDGHHFFFNTEYGEFQFLFDGVDVARKESVDKSYEESFQNVVACMLMNLFTGTNIAEQNEILMAFDDMGEDDDETGLVWDQETGSFVASPAALNAWNSLPEKLSSTLFEAVFAEKRRTVTLDEWESLICEGIAEAEECVFCGKYVLKTAKQCICCGNATEKADLLTKWLIENTNQPQYLRITFGRGTTLAGAILGISSNSSDFMRLVYNAKNNALGVKNLSNLSWYVADDCDRKEIMPGKVMLIEDGLEITFDGYSDVSMRFLGYEVK